MGIHSFAAAQADGQRDQELLDHHAREADAEAAAGRRHRQRSRWARRRRRR